MSDEEKPRFKYKRTIVLLAILSTISLSTLVVAQSQRWYYGPERATTVVDYTVTMDTLPSQVTRYTLLTLTGQVNLDGTGQPDITVHILKNGIQYDTTITDSTGAYTYQYNVTDTPGPLKFQPAINQ